MNYDDIIGLPRPVSLRHKPMSMEARAAQFAPFAALTGHDAALAETARETVPHEEMSDDELRALSSRLVYAIQNIPSRHPLSFTVFVPDSRKAGGEYKTMEGIIAKYDPYDRVLTLADGTYIPVSNITAIDGELFDMYD